jgi:hypothetical protein
MEKLQSYKLTKDITKEILLMVIKTDILDLFIQIKLFQRVYTRRESVFKLRNMTLSKQSVYYVKNSKRLYIKFQYVILKFQSLNQESINK